MANKFVLQNFPELCDQDQYYRLDVVRGVSFENSYDPKMPFKTLIVNFSRYKAEYQFLDKIKGVPAKDIFKTYQVESSALALKVDVTNQIFLKPGSVWKNGSPIWEPSEFFNISINQSEKCFVSLSMEKNSGTIMPFIEKGFGIQFLKLPKSMINGNNVDVLIPTTEIIRYYFSGSTYLTKQLFNGALKEFKTTNKANKLFYSFEVDSALKKVYIWLKRNCYDLDAILIARALTDPEALGAMGHIYASLVYAKKNFKTKDNGSITEACPRTQLPFSDETDMEVLGQWLPPKKGEKTFTTFLVRAIEMCSHTLPFDALEIESIDSYKSSGNIDKDNPPKPFRNKKNNQSHLKPTILKEGESPSNFWQSEELEFYLRRFNHLQGVEITKVQKTSEEDVKTYLLQERTDNPNDGSSLPGDGAKDNSIQPWENRIIDAEPIPVSNRIASVSNTMLAILAKRQSLSAQPLPLGLTDDTIPFGLYSFERPEGKSNNYMWNLIGNRKRKVLLLEIKNDEGLKVYLLEIEGKGQVGFSLFLFVDDLFGRMNTLEGAVHLMYEIADNSGGRITSEILSCFKSISLKHVSTDNDSFSDRVDRAIMGLFDEIK